MLLEIACVHARVLDGIAAVNHHAVANIDAHMARASGIVSLLEEDQIARLGFCGRNASAHGTQVFCAPLAYIPTVAAVIEHPTYETGTVKSGSDTFAARYIGHAEIFFSLTDHICKLGV